MMLKGCLPVLLTRIITADELNRAAPDASQCSEPRRVSVLMFTPFDMI